MSKMLLIPRTSSSKASCACRRTIQVCRPLPMISMADQRRTPTYPLFILWMGKIHFAPKAWNADCPVHFNHGFNPFKVVQVFWLRFSKARKLPEFLAEGSNGSGDEVAAPRGPGHWPGLLQLLQLVLSRRASPGAARLELLFGFFFFFLAPPRERFFFGFCACAVFRVLKSRCCFLCFFTFPWVLKGGHHSCQETISKPPPMKGFPFSPFPRFQPTLKCWANKICQKKPTQ